MLSLLASLFFQESEKQQPTAVDGWLEHEPFFWGDVRMRRLENGKWVYRDLTDEERADYDSRNAW